MSSPVQTAHPGARLRMYSELAEWWPLISPPSEYAEDAAFYESALVAACERRPSTLLELGSGGGNNASFLKRRFDVVLVDLSPGLLDVSRRLNPECEHILGDMRTVRVGRAFDCVFVHDAVMYMTSESDLRKVMETAYVHCAAGGAALFAPDFVRETFRSSCHCDGHDGEGRALRYLEWTWDPDPNDSTYLVDYVYMLREGVESVRVLHDRHVEGVFSRRDWLRLLHEAGFSAEVVPCDHAEAEPGGGEVFVGRKSTTSSARGAVNPAPVL